jgi:hypothetical protein
MQSATRKHSLQTVYTVATPADSDLLSKLQEGADAL